MILNKGILAIILMNGKNIYTVKHQLSNKTLTLETCGTDLLMSVITYVLLVNLVFIVDIN